MVKDFWKDCKGRKFIKVINEEAWRVVELQEKLSIRKLVGSLEEQKILDDLIETSKPPVINERKLHSLLITPFRYPPLKYGSRFGKRTEPSIWYRALEIATAFALAEKAYYQAVFISGCHAN